MAIISYAQNGEDVILRRAFGDIERGFYIDIGAYDPTSDSVTRAFYDAGWSGINVEPVPALHARFVLDRYRDLNLNIAVARQAGLVELNVIPQSGLSTIRRDVASRHEAAGWPRRAITVPALICDDVFAYAQGRAVHFLKIDAEGAEADILSGLDLTRHRPWVIVVEATEPGSEVRSDDAWAPLLAEHGYTNVYFDGLNLYFLADEHADRREALAKPPNIFDHYVTYAQHLEHGEVIAKADRQAELEGEIRALQADIARLETERAAADAELDGLRQDARRAAERELGLAWEREDAEQRLAERTREFDEALQAAALREEEQAASAGRTAEETTALIGRLAEERDALLEKLAGAESDAEAAHAAAEREAAAALAATRHELDRHRGALAAVSAERVRLERRLVSREAELDTAHRLRREHLRLLAVSGEKRARARREPPGVGKPRRFGLAKPVISVSTVRGHIDLLMDGVASGWVCDLARPDESVVVRAVIGGQVVAAHAAAEYRPDLQAAGLGGGRHGFHMALPEDILKTLGPEPVEMRVEALTEPPFVIAIFDLTDGETRSILTQPEVPERPEEPEEPMVLAPEAIPEPSVPRRSSPGLQVVGLTSDALRVLATLDGPFAEPDRLRSAA